MKHLNIACLADGTYVQIGRPKDWSQAQTLHAKLCPFYSPSNPARYVNGQPVRFMRVREVGFIDHFTITANYPLSALSTKQEVSTMKNRTPSGIARPKTGGFASWNYARSVAKRANAHGVGRGHRAIKAQDGNYTVVFRPAVTTNKQRKVRVV